MTRLLAVYNGSNSLIMRFEYADSRMPIAMTRGGATYYLTYDQVGSLKAVADGAGNVVKRVNYDSFGNIVDDTDPSFEMPFGFAGGLHDRDTGLVRFGYRDYDPDIGRWTAKDPILFAGGDTDLFGYVLNDPVNWIDPLGLESENVYEHKRKMNQRPNYNFVRFPIYRVGVVNCGCDQVDVPCISACVYELRNYMSCGNDPRRRQKAWADIHTRAGSKVEIIEDSPQHCQICHGPNKPNAETLK